MEKVQLTFIHYPDWPIGSSAALSSSAVSNPTFTPDKAGVYVVGLVLYDGQVNCPADFVTIRAGVPDIGQTRWYSTAFGDDGDYTINPMSYTGNRDGTILDNVTVGDRLASARKLRADDHR